MRPHYSQSSRENVTPSSGSSPLVSYKEVPPIPRKGKFLHKSDRGAFRLVYEWKLQFVVASSLRTESQYTQLNLHTDTFLQRPIFGRNSIHWHLFRPLYNGHFLLSPRSPFYLLAKVANWSQVSLHCWKSGIWSSLIIWLVTKYHWTRAIIVQLWLLHWAYFHLKSTLLVRTPRYNGKPD